MAYEFLVPRKIIIGENSIEVIPDEMRGLKKITHSLLLTVELSRRVF
jgi:hypothetical protein